MKNLLITAFTFLFSFSALAFEDNQSMLIKFRGIFANTSAKHNGLPKASVSNPEKVQELFKMGLGVEVALDYFFTENFAIEGGTGLTILKSRNRTLNQIAQNYGASNSLKNHDLFTMPTYTTLQYHVAPYGAIRPYVGAGFHYTYNQARSSHYKLDASSGFVLQAGVDVVFTDDSYLTFDLRYFNSESKIKYSKKFITDSNGNAISPKLKINPIYVGVGLGMKL